MPVKLQEFQHVKSGRSAAFVRTKIKNLVTGSVQDRTFRAGESITPANIEKVEMQYTYSDADSFCFMNMESFEEERIDKKIVEDAAFLVEGEQHYLVLKIVVCCFVVCIILFRIMLMFCGSYQ
jgi:elongation factor P